MVKLILRARDCISCGICMDVCAPGALEMRAFRRIGVEGAPRSASDPVAEMGTFPFLQDAGLCDGCLLCVEQCPVEALSLVRASGVETQGPRLPQPTPATPNAPSVTAGLGGTRCE